MLQVTKRGLLMDSTSTTNLREMFERELYVRLPGFFSPEVLSLIEPHISAENFFERVGEGRELCMQINGAVAAVLLLVNDEALFELIRRITGCGRIHAFEGRVYRLVGGTNQYQRWHNDMVENRFVAMSVNLGEPYGGGVLQVRDRSSKKILAEVSNTKKGDAILFQISRKLEHRITQVTDSSIKTTFAGWFKGTGSFLHPSEHVEQGKNGGGNPSNGNT